eukprot:g1289.t1
MVEQDCSVLMDQLYDFCARRNVRQRFRVFYFEHRSTFSGLNTDDDEQPHEMMVAFQRWEELVEEDIAEFLAEFGMEHTMFYESCAKFQHEQHDDDSALADTLQIVLSALDFWTFVKLMKAQVREQQDADADAESMGL